MMEKNPEEKIHLLILLSRDSAFTIMTSYPQIKTLTDCLQIASALMPPVCTRQILFQNKKNITLSIPHSEILQEMGRM